MQSHELSSLLYSQLIIKSLSSIHLDLKNFHLDIYWELKFSKKLHLSAYINSIKIIPNHSAVKTNIKIRFKCNSNMIQHLTIRIVIIIIIPLHIPLAHLKLVVMEYAIKFEFSNHHYCSLDKGITGWGKGFLIFQYLQEICLYAPIPIMINWFTVDQNYIINHYQ